MFARRSCLTITCIEASLAWQLATHPAAARRGACEHPSLHAGVGRWGRRESRQAAHQAPLAHSHVHARTAVKPSQRLQRTRERGALRATTVKGPIHVANIGGLTTPVARWT